MTLREAQEQADSNFAGYLSVIQAAQDTYVSRVATEEEEDIPFRGKYAQILPVSSSVPADGNTVPVDRRDRMPTDQKESWDSLNIQLPARVTSRVRVDVYESPEGVGYVVVQEMMHEGVLYRKHFNTGPETFRDSDWTAVIEEEIRR